MLRLRIFSQLIFNHEICGDTRVQFEPDPETPGSLSELSRSLAMTSGSSDRLFLGPGYRRKASIFVRKALRVRPRDQQCVSIGRLAGKDLRFSMKMMLAPDSEFRYSPSELLLDSCHQKAKQVKLHIR